METLKFSINPLYLHNQLFVPQNSRILGVNSKKGATFSFSLTCKFNPSSKGMKISKKNKISNWPDSGVALPLLERNNGTKLKKELLKGLLNLPLAIGETFAVAALMALGNHKYLTLFLTSCMQWCGLRYEFNWIQYYYFFQQENSTKYQIITHNLWNAIVKWLRQSSLNFDLPLSTCCY